MRPTIQSILSALVLSISIANPVLAQETMKAHFIDIGQGDATLLEFPCGVAMIDTGGERWPSEERVAARYDSNPVLYAYLDEFFRSRPDLERRIDVLFLTHPHADHTRGAFIVVDEFEPRHIVHNGQSYGSGIDGQNYARDYASRNEEVDAWYVLEDKIGASGLTNGTIDPFDECVTASIRRSRHSGVKCGTATAGARRIIAMATTTVS